MLFNDYDTCLIGLVLGNTDISTAAARGTTTGTTGRAASAASAATQSAAYERRLRICRHGGCIVRRGNRKTGNTRHNGHSNNHHPQMFGTLHGKLSFVI